MVGPEFKLHASREKDANPPEINSDEDFLVPMKYKLEKTQTKTSPALLRSKVKTQRIDASLSDLDSLIVAALF